jgi:hypothetical protein
MPTVIKEEIKPTPIKKNVNDVDCLLVSCSELVPIFTFNLKLKCDESFLEESAINSINRSIQRQLSGEG